ncbi:MoCF biosynth domain-containing protein [Citrus sinensis]|nr:MoCF biosynth domain-containing protein [Citrus sinensis]
MANPTSAKHGRDAGFIRGDPHLNWQDAFWGVWAPQEQIRAGLLKAQSGQYLTRSGLGHDKGPVCVYSLGVLYLFDSLSRSTHSGYSLSLCPKRLLYWPPPLLHWATVIAPSPPPSLLRLDCLDCYCSVSSVSTILCRINLGCSLRTPLTNPSLELHHTIVAEYQDETCCKEPDVTFVKADDPKPMTLVSWKVKAGGIDQGIDILLVPSSPRNQLEKFAALKDVNGVKNLLSTAAAPYLSLSAFQSQGHAVTVHSHRQPLTVADSSFTIQASTIAAAARLPHLRQPLQPLPVVAVAPVKMEIDKAIRESDDRRLKTKYNNAINVIQRTLALYSMLMLESTEFDISTALKRLPLVSMEEKIQLAGYFLHKGEQSCSNGSLTFPIRTIYFESNSAFPEINSFTYDTASKYVLQLDIIRSDFKSGLEALLNAKPIRAIFLGVRIGDPTAVGQEQFSPSSPGWPPFMRVNPILDWSYSYTSIGSIHDTVPNALLCVSDSSNNQEKFKPAYMLSDGRLERAGRVKKVSPSICGTAVANVMDNVDSHKSSLLKASAIAVGDEILFGTIEDQLGPSLCKKLHSIGWSVSQIAVLQNDIDSVAEEVERQKASHDMVFVYGGVGPLHSDVTLAGVAKAFGVRLAPDEEFEEYLRQLIGDRCTGDRNEQPYNLGSQETFGIQISQMALLPEGTTELLHHDKLLLPLIKCQNVIILTATNVTELDKEWNCLIELLRSGGLSLMEPYTSKSLTTNLSDLEAAQPLSKLCLEFPDLHIVLVKLQIPRVLIWTAAWPRTKNFLPMVCGARV